MRTKTNQLANFSKPITESCVYGSFTRRLPKNVNNNSLLGSFQGPWARIPRICGVLHPSIHTERRERERERSIYIYTHANVYTRLTRSVRDQLRQGVSPASQGSPKPTSPNASPRARPGTLETMHLDEPLGL